MIPKMSELFELDVKEFQRYLQALDSSAIELEELIESRNYLETEISMYITHLRDLFHRISSIYELIETKAERYRPDNRIIHEFLRELENPLKKLEMLIIGKVWHDFEYVPGYIPDGLYVDLKAIRDYVGDIENILRSAVQSRAFI
jgi:predicted nuclease with TOPRIM domain